MIFTIENPTDRTIPFEPWVRNGLWPGWTYICVSAPKAARRRAVRAGARIIPPPWLIYDASP